MVFETKSGMEYPRKNASAIVVVPNREAVRISLPSANNASTIFNRLIIPTDLPMIFFSDAI